MTIASIVQSTLFYPFALFCIVGGKGGVLFATVPKVPIKH